jgi:hypothetical protein
MRSIVLIVAQLLRGFPGAASRVVVGERHRLGQLRHTAGVQVRNRSQRPAGEHGLVVGELTRRVDRDGVAPELGHAGLPHPLVGGVVSGSLSVAAVRRR